MEQPGTSYGERNREHRLGLCQVQAYLRPWSKIDAPESHMRSLVGKRRRKIQSAWKRNVQISFRNAWTCRPQQTSFQILKTALQAWKIHCGKNVWSRRFCMP